MLLRSVILAKISHNNCKGRLLAEISNVNSHCREFSTATPIIVNRILYLISEISKKNRLWNVTFDLSNSPNYNIMNVMLGIWEDLGNLIGNTIWKIYNSTKNKKRIHQILGNKHPLSFTWLSPLHHIHSKFFIPFDGWSPFSKSCHSPTPPL